MRTLAIMEQGVRLGVQGGEFVLSRGGKKFDQVRSGDIDQLLLFGSVELTPGALQRILEVGLDAVFLSRRGRYRGRLVAGLGGDGRLRIGQYRALSDEGAKLAVARAVVAGKIANQRVLLLRVQREREDFDVAGEAARLRFAVSQCASAPVVAALRGIEGSAAAAYFPKLSAAIVDTGLRFAHRSRRPPRDPANAVLSFGYTLLTGLVDGLVRRVGLDPALGALHEPVWGRPALALDLVEEFRPVLVDALLLRLFNRRELRAADFDVIDPDHPGDALEGEDPDRHVDARPAVHLGDRGRRIFFRAWKRRLRQPVLYEPAGQRLAWEDVVERQVRAMARHFRDWPDSAGYVPFRYR